MLTKCLIERCASGNEREMSKGLRKVSECFTRRADLLRVESNVIAIRQQFLQHQTSLVQATDTGQVLHKPETARAKGSFLAAQPIISRFLRIITAHQRSAG